MSDQVRRRQRLVREPEEQRLRSVARFVLLLALLFAPVAWYVVEQNECLSLSYEMSEIRSETERLRKVERALRIDQARLESLAEIERWAVGRQGLCQPEPAEVVVVREPAEGSGDLLARGSR